MSSRVTRPRSFLACSPRREENISAGLSRSPLAYHLPTSCRASRESCFQLPLLSGLPSTCAEATGVPIKTAAIVINRSHLFVFMYLLPFGHSKYDLRPFGGESPSAQFNYARRLPPNPDLLAQSEVNYCRCILPLPLPLTVPLPLPLKPLPV